MAEAAVASIRPDRRAGQQCGALRRAARRPVRRDRRGRLGCGDGGQRQRHLALLQGGGAGDAAVNANGRVGSIVNIASLAATYGMPFALHYTTSKAAVIGLTRGLARELGRDRHPRQRAGAERGFDRRHARVFRRQARPGIGDDQGRAVDPAQPRPRPISRHGAVAGFGRERLCYRADHRRRWRHGDAVSPSIWPARRR